MALDRPERDALLKLKKPELQEIAKKGGIRPNQKKEDLVEAILASSPALATPTRRAGASPKRKPATPQAATPSATKSSPARSGSPSSASSGGASSKKKGKAPFLNIGMWGKALRVIPRVSKDEWMELDVVSKWLISTRSAVLVMTFIASAIGGLLAARDGAFDWPRWGLVTVGLIFAHATNNLVNDFTDHFMGVDKDNYFRTKYGPQPLEHGLMSVKEALAYIVVTGLIALSAGLYLVSVTGVVTLQLLGAGAFFVLFYTWPLKYIGLGEVAVILVWGPLMVGGCYYVLAGKVTVAVLIASLPFAVAASTVLFGKHIDKIEADTAKRIRTMPVLLGDTLARYTTIALLLTEYLLVTYSVLRGDLSAFVAVVFLALPVLVKVIKVYLAPRPHAAPADYPPNVWPLWFSSHSFLHTRVFGSFFLLGLGADLLAHHYLKSA